MFSTSFIKKQGGICTCYRHRQMYKLANWSRQSNVTSCSRAPGRATEEQAKQPNIHMRKESST
jgi:hypothetical protein